MRRPQLRGTGIVGQPVRATGPALWCRDGAPIAGAAGPSYTPTAADDGCLLSARINTPEGPLETAALRIRQPAPQVRPLVLDDVFDWLSGAQVIETAQAFSGPALRYRIEGGPASIDATTGRVTVPTDRPHAGRDLTVFAENSGGAAALDFRVTVEAPGHPAETYTADEIDIDGITFTFNEPVRIGHFITGAAGLGDPFVIGPVRLLSYSPGPTTSPKGGARNGAMLNPNCDTVTGFDSRASRKKYKPELNAGLRLPLALKPGDSLIVARSNMAAKASPKDAIERFVVLTCLAEAPPEDAFRPPFAAGEKPLFRLSDVEASRLAALQLRGRPPALADLAARFDRFAVDISPSWLRDHFGAPGHPPLYGRDLCADESAPYIVVNSTLPLERKLPILAGLIQRGIDRAGLFANSVARGRQPWRPDGSHNSGRKFSIMFAGHLLGVDWMRNVAKHALNEFHEDAMTFYVDDAAVKITNGPDWKPAYGNKRPQQPYEPGMIGMPDWRGSESLAKASASWEGHPYRVAGNHNTMHGQVLALLAMGLRDAWAHEAYFDYHMRYMEIMAGRPDPWRFQGGKQAHYNPVTGSHPGTPFPGWQQRWHNPWSLQMLEAYRFEYYTFPWQ